METGNSTGTNSDQYCLRVQLPRQNILLHDEFAIYDGNCNKVVVAKYNLQRSKLTFYNAHEDKFANVEDGLKTTISPISPETWISQGVHVYDLSLPPQLFLI